MGIFNLKQNYIRKIMEKRKSFVEILNRRVSERMGKEVPRKDIERGLKYILFGFVGILVLIICLIVFLCSLF